MVFIFPVFHSFALHSFSFANNVCLSLCLYMCVCVSVFRLYFNSSLLGAIEQEKSNSDNYYVNSDSCKDGIKKVEEENKKNTVS